MMRLALALVLATTAACTVRAAELPPALVEPYVSVQEKLAADTIEGVAADAAQIAAAAASLGSSAEKLAEASRKLERAVDLKNARDAFGAVSDALFAYMKSNGAMKPAHVKAGFCPMANHRWLQKGDTVRNPYYGSEMLECGELTK